MSKFSRFRTIWAAVCYKHNVCVTNTQCAWYKHTMWAVLLCKHIVWVISIVDTVDTADIVHTVDTLDNVKSVNSVDNVSSVNSVHNVPVLEHVPLSASFRKDPEGPLYP